MKKIHILFLLLLFIPTVNKKVINTQFSNQITNKIAIIDTNKVILPINHHKIINYDSIYKDIKPYKKISKNTFIYAYKGYKKLIDSGLIRNRKYLTVCDFTKPSNTPRMYVINMKSNKIEICTWVAHGRMSGNVFTKKFSNKMNSHESSIGFFITKNIYVGKNGPSLRINGVDGSYNSNAYNRAIVIHGSKYIGSGKCGRSFGCPAVPMKISNVIISYIKNGSCFFIYYPLKSYIQKSRILN
jgi:hypothetical protein